MGVTDVILVTVTAFAVVACALAAMFLDRLRRRRIKRDAQGAVEAMRAELQEAAIRRALGAPPQTPAQTWATGVLNEADSGQKTDPADLAERAAQILAAERLTAARRHRSGLPAEGRLQQWWYAAWDGRP
jgi:hypothetical protein